MKMFRMVQFMTKFVHVQEEEFVPLMVNVSSQILFMKPQFQLQMVTISFIMARLPLISSQGWPITLQISDMNTEEKVQPLVFLFGP